MVENVERLDSRGAVVRPLLEASVTPDIEAVTTRSIGPRLAQ